jgi:hypothetical protein
MRPPDSTFQRQVDRGDASKLPRTARRYSGLRQMDFYCRPSPAIRSGCLIRSKAVIRGIPADYFKGRVKAAQRHCRLSKFM